MYYQPLTSTENKYDTKVKCLIYNSPWKIESQTPPTLPPIKCHKLDIDRYILYYSTIRFYIPLLF